MRNGINFLLSLVLLSMISCSDEDIQSEKPVAGVLIVADSMRIAEDDLNELYFIVKVLTTESSDSGEYEVMTTWGYNNGQAIMKLPHGLEQTMPVLRSDSGYSYIVGFQTEQDSSFHDYFKVSSEAGNIVMRYIKAYYYE